MLCDVANHDGSPVVASPRQVLIAQYERAHEMGYTPMFASELEFYLYKESYAEAHEKDYRGPHADDPLHPRLPHPRHDDGRAVPRRRSAAGCTRAGIPVEFSKGEAWYGQHEVNTRYADAVTSADRHTIYKNGVKEIAFLNGISATFMAKPSEKDIGSSCHIHSSLVGADSGESVFVDGDEETDIFRHYLGGMRAHDQGAGAVRRAVDQLLQALRDGELGADVDLLGPRQPHLRLSRSSATAQSRRVECRIPGADVNPYLGYAALLAAGLDGIEQGTDPGPGARRATRTPRRRPSRSRRPCARRSTCGREATSPATTFGEDVWRHYLNYGRTEQRLFDEVVTDYERRRMFERG